LLDSLLQEIIFTKKHALMPEEVISVVRTIQWL